MPRFSSNVDLHFRCLCVILRGFLRLFTCEQSHTNDFFSGSTALSAPIERIWMARRELLSIKGLHFTSFLLRMVELLFVLLLVSQLFFVNGEFRYGWSPHSSSAFFSFRGLFCLAFQSAALWMAESFSIKLFLCWALYVSFMRFFYALFLDGSIARLLIKYFSEWPNSSSSKRREKESQ
jgi:hypothetical protein